MKAANGFSRYTFMLAALFVICAVVCALFISVGENAYADAAMAFEISTDDGENWILKCEGTQVYVASGVFFGEGSTAGSQFLIKIIEILRADGRADDDYVLTFTLPSINASVEGDVDFVYSDEESALVIKPSYTRHIGSTNEVLEIRYDGETDFSTYLYYEKVTDGLTFGKKANVGTCYVRVAVTEAFLFDGRNYTVPRFGTPIECTVSKGVPPIVADSTRDVVYGTKKGDLASYISDYSGTWTLASSQNANDILPAGQHTVYFDFVSDSGNYAPKREVPLSVNVLPKEIVITIGNAYSLVGEPVNVSAIDYVVSRDLLVEGDSEEDLNVTLLTDGINKDVAGMYIISASIANDNYNLVCRNDVYPISGGRYMVYATAYSATAEDGVTFKAYVTDAIDGTFSAHVIQNEWTNSAVLQNARQSVVGCYKIEFVKMGEHMSVPSGYTVEFDVKGVTHTAVVGDELLAECISGYAGSARFDNDETTLILLKHIDKYTSGEMLTPANIALITLTVVFAVVLGGAVGIYIVIRRRAK